MLRKWIGTYPLWFLVAALGQGAATDTMFVGMGDSIGEGVQSADASVETQKYSYQNLIAAHMGAVFPLPLIASGPFGVVGETTTRSRIDPTVRGLNLAVSGADVHSLLNDRADGVINSETDLVLLPRMGSQMEIAESLRPIFVACWIGNNDALGAATAFYKLDASQLTSVQDFTQDFTAIATRLQAMGTKAVFGTIGDVSRIAFLLTRDQVVAVLGSAGSMGPNDRTGLPTVLLIRLGLAPLALLDNPDFVLTAAEAAIISQRITDFNTVIKSVAAAKGMAVADIHQLFEQFAANPPVIFGVPLLARYLGGLFSLDGVHPSDIGNAVVANEFLNSFNSHYGTNFPLLSLQELIYVFLTDPFVDHDQDGRVKGRLGAGLLETVAALLKISGDPDDFDPTVSKPPSLAGVDSSLGSRFLDEYEQITHSSLRGASLEALVDALNRMFGLERFQTAAQR
jgi:hypothetical protein